MDRAFLLHALRIVPAKCDGSESGSGDDAESVGQDRGVESGDATSVPLRLGDAVSASDSLLPSIYWECNRRARRRMLCKGLFVGAARRSAQHALYMRMCKLQKKTEAELASALDSNRAVNAEWNYIPLRHGDKVAGEEAGQGWRHPNIYDAANVLRTAFRCVHSKKVDRNGIEGSTKTMSMTCTTASAFLSHQDEWVDGAFEAMLAKRPCISVYRSYDATPWRLRFGRFADTLAPHARYLCRRADGQGWVLVSAAEYAERNGGRTGRFGTLEVLAQKFQVNYVTRNGCVHGFRKLLPPMILERGNASTIHAAVEASAKQVSKEKLEDLCRACPYVWMMERPDAHSANMRMRARGLKDREHIGNCFDMPGCCCAHQGSRCVASRETGVIGNLYALGWTGGNVATQARYRKGLWEIVDEDLNQGWHLTNPHDSWQPSNKAML